MAAIGRLGSGFVVNWSVLISKKGTHSCGLVVRRGWLEFRKWDRFARAKHRDFSHVVPALGIVLKRISMDLGLKCCCISMTPLRVCVLYQKLW